MQLGKVPPTLPDIRADLAVSMIVAGWTASLITVLAVGLGIAAGIFADRIGYRRVIIHCLGLLAVGSLLGAVADSACILLASRVVEGIGFVGLVVATPSLIARSTRARDRRLALGAWAAYMPIGMAVMAALASLLLAPLGWRGLWLANAIVIVLFLLLFVPGTYDGAPERVFRAGRRTWRDARMTATRPGPWLLGFCFTAIAAQWMGIMAWLPTFLIDTQGRSTAAAAALAALVMIANAPASVIGVWLVDRNVPRWLLLLSVPGIMGLLGLAIFLDVVADDLKLPVIFIYSFMGGMPAGVIFSSAPLHAPAPDQLATVNGIIIQGANLGNLAGPPTLAAVFILAGGWHGAGWYMLVCGLAAAALALAVRRVEKRMG